MFDLQVPVKETLMQYAPLHQLEYQDTVDDLKRLELLLPIHRRPDRRELKAYVLAFVECYKDDVVQLEHEWQLLQTTLLWLWQHAEYAQVVHLVAALTRSISRRCTFAKAWEILRMGIDASRYVQDSQHLATFLSRLGCMYFAHGCYWQGWRLWYQAWQHAEASRCPGGFWEPLSGFAYVVDILGSYPASQQFAEMIFSTHHSDDIESVCVALFARGFNARLSNDIEQAYQDFSTCLQILPTISTGETATARKLFTLVVQTELARTQGDYVRSQCYTESALALAEVFSDHYTVAALLADQGFFTYTQGHIEDTYAVYLRLRDVVEQVDIPQFYNCRHFLEQRLASFLPESRAVSSTNVREILSTREIEVLQLVSDGLSNRDIAHKLVVTQGTVKKHLEHIYNKLDVRSRTAALARAKTHGYL